MENTFEFKNLSEVEQLAVPTADTTVMGFEAGKPVQMPADALNPFARAETMAEPTEATMIPAMEDGKGVLVPARAIKGGSVFVIDSTAEDYSLTSTEYGNKVKEALLRGDTVYVYQYETYTNVVAFGIVESTTGAATLKVYPSALVNNNGLALNDQFSDATHGYLSFAITL